MRCLVSLRNRGSENYIPEEIIWMQVPLLPSEVRLLEKKAKIEGFENAAEVVRQLIYDSV